MVVRVYAVHEVGATLNHALVDEFLIWFLLARHAEVEEELVPEARVDEVTRSVLATSYVEVYVLPVVVGILAHEACVVVRIHIAQIVSRRASEARHSVQLEWEDGLVVHECLVYHLAFLHVPRPHLGASQWRLAGFCRLVCLNLGQQ